MSRVGGVLGVTYCLSGTLEQQAGKIAITLDLVDTRSHQVIWGECYSSAVETIHELRASIVASITTALEYHVPLHEAQVAALRSTEHLDAWALYHLALQRMFRFTHADNDAALALLEQAVARDRSFARAYAALSFIHFQSAFMRYVPNAEREADLARQCAERALELDAAEPFANLVYGRSLWLTGSIADSLPWIERALALNPNYAQAAYAHALGDAIRCHGANGQRHADRAMALSPIDPMHYAMLGARALSHAVRGEHAEGAHWSDRAARAPNSHKLIAMIAVLCHALAGREAEARTWAEIVRRHDQSISGEDFFRAFPFERDDVRTSFAHALKCFGF